MIALHIFFQILTNKTAKKVNKQSNKETFLLSFSMSQYEIENHRNKRRNVLPFQLSLFAGLFIIQNTTTGKATYDAVCEDRTREEIEYAMRTILPRDARAEGNFIYTVARVGEFTSRPGRYIAYELAERKIQ